MRFPVSVPALCAILLSASLLLAGCTLPGGQGTPAPTPVPTPVPTTAAAIPSPGPACGVTNCHGLDVTCGSVPPMACTMEYQIGDKCRKLVSCQPSGSRCVPVTSAAYTACRACVEHCQIAAGADNLAAFSCEEKC